MKLFKSFLVTSILVLSISCQSDDIKSINSLNNQPKTIQSLSERAPEPLGQLHPPFDFPLVLSGNFGELRPNHFHSGIDFKTQGKTGKPIHCAEDGYISQVSVSGSGYGRALYVTHPLIGLTTVYAHIENFSPKIDSIVKKEQYRHKTFNINLKFSSDSIKVNKGEIIAFSGNSGNSFGPHLHMEIRHTVTNDAIDPLPYFKTYIKDTIAPIAHNLILYPVPGFGYVNGTSEASKYAVNNQKNTLFYAWGKVYPAIDANDYMNNTHNVFGIKYLSLMVDGKKVYTRIIDRFKFNATRAINTLIDYTDLINNGDWNMYTRIPTSKPLGCIIESSLNDGAIDINEEKNYNCMFILKDEYNNCSQIPFTIKGEKMMISNKKDIINNIKYNITDTLNIPGINVIFFNNCLYDDANINITKSKSSFYHSPIYHIGEQLVPIARPYRIAIDVNPDTINNPQQYYIVRIGKNKQHAIRSRYRNGKMIAYVNMLGKYAINVDKDAPRIIAINKDKWNKNQKITFKITDQHSGIRNYSGEIDGKWVMFEADTKTATITYAINESSLQKNKQHVITINAIDNCGNSAKLTSLFSW